MGRYDYHQTISHPGLGITEEVYASSPEVLWHKVEEKRTLWSKQWRAKEQTDKAEKMQEDLDSILASSVQKPERFFEDIKNHAPFSEPFPEKPIFAESPAEPLFSDSKYHPKPSLLTRFSRQKKDDYEAECESLYKADHQAWEAACAEIDRNNFALEAAYSNAVSSWAEKKDEYEKTQEKLNSTANRLREAFLARDVEVVTNTIEYAINKIDVPLAFETNAAAEFNPEDESVILDVFLPVLEDIPTLKSVSYVKTKDEYKTTHYPASFLKKKYESVIYQLVMRFIKCVFAIESENSPIKSLVLNGRINTVDKATGKTISPYILSVSATRDSFCELNLEAIDPKAWFKSSKGVSAASVATITPVAPIVQMSTDDRRFIEGYSVEDKLDSGVNLAAMDWQDFENFIRELFEQEFSVPGGEVKITQASRDGGVDAVAFDPDPIRGGKIEIQAKRYTNTVGVSAVRDLYGTVLNEGAMKGILVTTANYGNDAYEFAKGKPLTLMNGANLLYLLEKHGHHARIDLQEAKAMLSE